MKPNHVIPALLIAFFIIPSAMALTSEKIYFLGLNYDRGALELLDVNVITGFPILTNDASLPYKLELLSANNESLYTGYFEVPNKLQPLPPRPGETKEPNAPASLELQTVNFSISLPYHKQGRTIRITKDGEEVLLIDVSKFSQFCGDGTCQYDENEASCPADCAVSEQVPVKEGEVPTQEDGKPSTLYLIAGAFGFLFLLGVFVAVYLKHRKAPPTNYPPVGRVNY